MVAEGMTKEEDRDERAGVAHTAAVALYRHRSIRLGLGHVAATR